MPKKAAGRKPSPVMRRQRKGALLFICLALSLASVSAGLALWGRPRTAPATPTPLAAPAAASVAAARPAQNSYAPSSPAKEYIYAGGRLVATEEPPAPAGPPSPPSRLRASGTYKTVLSWRDHSTTETGFKIERRNPGEAAWIQIATVGANVTQYSLVESYSSCEAAPHFRVRATNLAGDSAYSNEAHPCDVYLDTDGSCPTAAETTFTASSYLINAGDSVQLSWSAPHATSIEMGVREGREFFTGYTTTGIITIGPSNTTTINLWARGAPNCAVVQKQVTIEVIPNPDQCSPGAYFIFGQPLGDTLQAEGYLILEWSVPNAASLTISDHTGANYGTFGPSGQIYVWASGNTTYTLTAQIRHSAACSPFALMLTYQCSDCSGDSMY